MPLVIAKSICRREFGSEEVPPQFMDTLQRSLSVDLATAIKGSNLPKATKLLKVYATSPEGAMRIVHLMATEDGTLFLLFFRNKKDKVGANITIHNKEFRRQLHKHLDLLQEAINAGSYFVLDDNSPA
jgi:hypothetical protein